MTMRSPATIHRPCSPAALAALAWALWDAPQVALTWTAVATATSYRVYRGGSWDSWPPHLRSAGRFRSGPAARAYIIGFRVARTLSSTP